MRKAVRNLLFDLAVPIAFLGGWLLVTAGVAEMSIYPRRIWLLSIGVLLLAFVGFKFIYILARDGVYAHTREK